MLGNTLALTIGGNPFTLVKINQDSYSSEYLFRDTDAEYRARVRHTKAGGKNGDVVKDRHNFELTVTHYATPTTDRRVQKVYYVIEQVESDLDVDVATAAFALATASSSAFLESLMGWES